MNTDLPALPEPSLLPCPFCGHTTPYFERMGTPRQSCIVACGDCGARHESSDEGTRSGSSWNTRAALAAQQPAAEAVAEVYRAHYGNNKRDIGFDSVRLLPGAKVEPGMKLYAAAPAVPQVAAQQPAAQSLLRKPVKHISEISAQIPGGCYCPPGTCQAPVIMGRQTPCLRRQDAAPPAPQPETKGGAA